MDLFYSLCTNTAQKTKWLRLLLQWFCYSFTPALPSTLSVRLQKFLPPLPGALRRLLSSPLIPSGGRTPILLPFHYLDLVVSLTSHQSSGRRGVATVVTERCLTDAHRISLVPTPRLGTRGGTGETPVKSTDCRVRYT